MNVINRVVGAALGLLIVYLVFAIVVAFVVGPLGGLVPFVTDSLKPEVEASWIRNHIYTDEGNFFGNWIIGTMAEKIMEIIQGQQPEETARLIAKICSVSIA